MKLHDKHSLYDIAKELGILLPTLAYKANAGDFKTEMRIGRNGRDTMFSTMHNVLHAVARSSRILRKKHADVLRKYKYND